MKIGEIYKEDLTDMHYIITDINVGANPPTVAVQYLNDGFGAVGRRAICNYDYLLDVIKEGEDVLISGVGDEI
jgi:hypothetical protein